MILCPFRIQKETVDPEKLHATLNDASLNSACDLKRALEMVALLEAQLKEMNPDLDSIAESVFLCYIFTKIYLFLFPMINTFISDTGEKLPCTMNV